MINRAGFADLHIHTTFSDGKYSPEEVIGFAKSTGIDTMSITDHDSVDAFLNVDLAKLDITLFPGVELSTYHKGKDVHVLGYLFDINDNKFSDMLKNYRDVRNNRAGIMLERLAKHGFVFKDEDKESILTNNSVGRPHVAKLLYDYGYVKSTQEAFEKHIGDNCYAFVPKAKLSIPDAIKYIHEADGIAILAHPGLYGAFMSEVINLACDNGIDGLEIYHPKHYPNIVGDLKKIAEGRKLMITGGSDFHSGREDGHANIGDIKFNVSDMNELFFEKYEKFYNKFIANRI